MNQKFNLNELPRAYKTGSVRGVFRTNPQDFIVEEALSFIPTGSGEHAFLQIRKTGRNTEDIARSLARHAKIPRKSVSYAGLKDRNAVTTQYFSVHLPGQTDPNWEEMSDAAIEFLSVTRHQKKLKRGALKDNTFRLILRELVADKSEVETRLETIQQQGVPNYFTSQRFGHNANNLQYAEEMLLADKRIKDRFKRSMYYSAARSWLFNLVLAERIRNANWDQALPGDSMMLSGSRSCFHIDTIDDEIKQRTSGLDVSPTAPLWGRGDSMLTDQALELENSSLAQWHDWQIGLEKAGLQMARRSMRIPVNEFSWKWLAEDQLELAFSLQPGSYATAVLRELGDIQEYKKF